MHKKRKSQFILDIGAGDYPQPGATHAIDIQKPEKSPPPRILDYKIGNFNRPPKDWQGKFDEVVSEAALAASDSLESSVTQTGKALDYVTKPKAKARIIADLSQLKTLMSILAIAKFGVTSITAVNTPVWVGADEDIGGQIVVEAIKGYKGTRSEQALQKKLDMPPTWRMPIPIRRMVRQPIKS